MLPSLTQMPLAVKRDDAPQKLVERFRRKRNPRSTIRKTRQTEIDMQTPSASCPERHQDAPNVLSDSDSSDDSYFDSGDSDGDPPKCEADPNMWDIFNTLYERRQRQSLTDENEALKRDKAMRQEEERARDKANQHAQAINKYRDELKKQERERRNAERQANNRCGPFSNSDAQTFEEEWQQWNRGV